LLRQGARVLVQLTEAQKTLIEGMTQPPRNGHKKERK
jgi:hypothetical protein